MALCSTSHGWPNLRHCAMLFLTLSTFLLASFALPLHSNDDSESATQVTRTCSLADYQSVLLFFFANYIAHAGTVPSVPGCSTRSLLWTTVSVFYPFSGLIRSITMLFYHCTITEDEIGKAISQNAVMVATRSKHWVPRFTHNELIYVRLNPSREFPENTDSADSELPKAVFYTMKDTYSSPWEVETKNHAINGEAVLPKEYCWSKPKIRQLNTLASLTLNRKGIQVNRDRSLIKMVTSIAQLIFSVITLYRARGPQIQQYGYAAFGLSVFPYALMSLVNLVVVYVVGEYSTLFVLQTAILEEARRCGGKISGEIGTLPESAVVEGGHSLNEMEKDDDGEDKLGRAMPLPNSNDGGPQPLEKGGNLLGEHDAKKTTTDTPPEAVDEIGTGFNPILSYIMMHIRTLVKGDKKKDDYAGEPLIAAKIRVEDEVNGVLIITMKGLTKRFKLIEDNSKKEACDGNTFHFYVCPATNEEVPKSDSEMAVSLTYLKCLYYLCFTILAVVPYVFIFLLTGFRNGNSTTAERGWMMSWLAASQVSIFFSFQFTTEDNYFMASPWAAGFVFIIILIMSTPAIGGFVMVGKMLLEFDACSLP